MTEAQIKALILLMQNDKVYGGRDEIRGRVVRTSVGTLKALARMGFCRLQVVPDGGTWAVRP